MIDNKTLIAGGLIIAIFIGILAVFLASGDPDGLESTALMIQGEKTLTGSTPPNAEIQENMEGKFSYIPAMPDYSLGEDLGPLGGIIAIIVGTILAFVIALGVIYTLKVAGKSRELNQNQ